MTRNAFHPASIVKALPVVGVLLFGLVSGCGSGAPADEPATSTVGQSQQDWRFPRFCGGLWDPDGRECKDDEFCLPFMSRGCPGPHEFGFCFPRPHFCPKFSSPVCGCDGTTYDNLCDAAQAGVVMEHKGACAPTAPGSCASGGTVCPGSGVCADDAGDSCDPTHGGQHCAGTCTCDAIQPCAKGDTFDSDPSVCACVANGPDPCARIICPNGTQCIANPDGSTSCQ
jgi:hypothetical protein